MGLEPAVHIAIGNLTGYDHAYEYDFVTQLFGAGGIDGIYGTTTVSLLPPVHSCGTLTIC